MIWNGFQASQKYQYLPWREWLQYQIEFAHQHVLCSIILEIWITILMGSLSKLM